MVKKTEPLPRSYGIAPPAFRLPDTAHVGSVHLQVSDLRQSVVFYEEVLGLRAYTAATDAALLSRHGEEWPLVTLHTRKGVTQARRGAFGLYHFAILVPDRAALGRFAAHLSSLGIRVGMADHRVSESLYLSDPDGLGIEVYADRPRRTWQSHDRELAMATDPLDITSVIAAGGGEKWDGAPPGTTMGHVHQHFGPRAGSLSPSRTAAPAGARRSNRQRCRGGRKQHPGRRLHVRGHGGRRSGRDRSLGKAGTYSVGRGGI